MNRRIAWLPVFAVIALTGCNDNDSGSASMPASGTTTTTTTAATTTDTAAAGATEVTTPSGLRYEDLVVGTGITAERGMDVSVHYTGWLTDGTQFDTSAGGQPYPVKLGVSQVIQGWHEGIVGMKVGGKRKLTIPPALAYGDRGHPAGIPPNSTLVFHVELVDAK